MSLNYPFFFFSLGVFKKCRKENMKTYSLLKQISSENEVEKYSSFPHWLQLTGFLEVLHAHKKEKKKKKKINMLEKGRKRKEK